MAGARANMNKKAPQIFRNDNYDPEQFHVIAALSDKVHRLKIEKKPNGGVTHVLETSRKCDQ